MLRWLLIAVFIVLGYIVLSYLARILAPVLAALGIAYLLDPVLDRLVQSALPTAEEEIRSALRHAIVTPENEIGAAQREWLEVLRA